MKKAFMALVACVGLVACAEQAKMGDADIEKWIMDNPETIIKSLQTFEQKRMEENQPQPAMVSEYKSELFEHSSSPVGGNPKGEIEVAYFFDFRCGHCARQSQTIAEVLKKHDNVKVVYKVFPVLGPDSVTAARSALAAHQQGKFKEFYQALYETREFTPESMKAIASKLKLDVAKWEADLESDAVNSEIQHVASLADKMKVRGTPLLAIAPDQIFPGRVDQLDQIISAM